MTRLSAQALLTSVTSAASHIAISNAAHRQPDFRRGRTTAHRQWGLFHLWIVAPVHLFKLRQESCRGGEDSLPGSQSRCESGTSTLASSAYRGSKKLGHSPPAVGVRFVRAHLPTCARAQEGNVLQQPLSSFRLTRMVKGRKPIPSGQFTAQPRPCAS
jgi:hypothetical protein